MAEKPAILTVLESPFVLVFLAGLLGQMITSSYQERAKLRDLQSEWIKGDIGKRAEERAKLHQRQLAMTDTLFARLGGAITGSDELIRLRRREWDPRQYRSPVQDSVRVYRSQSRKVFNRNVMVWRESEYGVGASLDHAYGGKDDSLFLAWWGLVDCMDRYIELAESTYMASVYDTEWDSTANAARNVPCGRARAALHRAMVDVAGIMRVRRIEMLADDRAARDMRQVLKLAPRRPRRGWWMPEVLLWRRGV